MHSYALGTCIVVAARISKYEYLTVISVPIPNTGINTDDLVFNYDVFSFGKCAHSALQALSHWAVTGTDGAGRQEGEGGELYLMDEIIPRLCCSLLPSYFQIFGTTLLRLLVSAFLF